MNTAKQISSRPWLLVCLGLWTALVATKSLNAQDAPAESQQIQVLPLKHTSAVDVMQVMQRVTQGSGIELAADAQSNALIVRAAAAAQEEIKQVVAQLDVEQDTVRQVKISWQLRLVWLVAGLADDAAAAPPREFESVTQELAKLGVTNLTMAAQIVINVTEGEKFSASGSAKVNEPCQLEFSGMLGEMGPQGALPSDQPSLRVEISAAAAAGENVRPLCHLRTTCTAPPGRSVVLGITPVESKPAVFVVQVLPRIEAAAARKD